MTTDSAPAAGDPDEPAGSRIVVGVDDSEQAAAALRWALAEGALRQATVEVVHAWSPPMSALPFGATLVIPVDDGEIDATARAMDHDADVARIDVREHRWQQEQRGEDDHHAEDDSLHPRTALRARIEVHRAETVRHRARH